MKPLEDLFQTVWTTTKSTKLPMVVTTNHNHNHLRSTSPARPTIRLGRKPKKWGQLGLSPINEKQRAPPWDKTLSSNPRSMVHGSQLNGVNEETLLKGTVSFSTFTDVGKGLHANV